MNKKKSIFFFNFYANCKNVERAGNNDKGDSLNRIFNALHDSRKSFTGTCRVHSCNNSNKAISDKKAEL